MMPLPSPFSYRDKNRLVPLISTRVIQSLRICLPRVLRKFHLFNCFGTILPIAFFYLCADVVADAYNWIYLFSLALFYFGSYSLICWVLIFIMNRLGDSSKFSPSICMIQTLNFEQPKLWSQISKRSPLLLLPPSWFHRNTSTNRQCLGYVFLRPVGFVELTSNLG